MLERDFSEIPDLHFTIQLLISDAPYIASRLAFDCSPKGRFLGLDVNGKRISFIENVFYEFRDENRASMVGHRQGGHRSTALVRGAGRFRKTWQAYVQARDHRGMLILLIAIAGFFGLRSVFNESPFFDCWPLDWLEKEAIAHAPPPSDAVCYTVARNRIYYRTDAIPNWIVTVV